MIDQRETREHHRGERIAQPTKAILEQALQAEVGDHPGYEKHDSAIHRRRNTSNGKSQKTLRGDFGELELESPRDRQATFEPKDRGHV